jgi:hypothetical protein
MGERLEPTPEPGFGPAHSLGNGPNPARFAPEDRDDPVGLAQLVGPEHDAVVPVGTHQPIIGRTAPGGGRRASDLRREGRERARLRLPRCFRERRFPFPQVGHVPEATLVELYSNLAPDSDLCSSVWICEGHATERIRRLRRLRRIRPSPPH